MRETGNPSFGELSSKIDKLDLQKSGTDEHDMGDLKERNQKFEVVKQLNEMLGLGLENPLVDIKKEADSLVIRYDGWEGEPSADALERMKTDPSADPRTNGSVNAHYEIIVSPDMHWEKKIITRNETKVEKH